MKKMLLMLAVLAGFVVSSACNLIKPPTKPGELTDQCMFDTESTMAFGDVTCRTASGANRDVASFRWEVLKPVPSEDGLAFYNRASGHIESGSGCDLVGVGFGFAPVDPRMGGFQLFCMLEKVGAGSSGDCTVQDPNPDENNWQNEGKNGQPEVGVRVYGTAFCPSGYLK